MLFWICATVCMLFIGPNTGCRTKGTEGNSRKLSFNKLINVSFLTDICLDFLLGKAWGCVIHWHSLTLTQLSHTYSVTAGFLTKKSRRMLTVWAPNKIREKDSYIHTSRTHTLARMHNILWFCSVLAYDTACPYSLDWSRTSHPHPQYCWPLALHKHHPVWTAGTTLCRESLEEAGESTTPHDVCIQKLCLYVY